MTAGRYGERDAQKVILLYEPTPGNDTWQPLSSPGSGGGGGTGEVVWDVDGGFSNSEYGVLDGGASGSF